MPALKQKDYLAAGVKIRKPSLLNSNYRYVFPLHVNTKEEEIVYGMHYAHTFVELKSIFPTLDSLNGDP